MVLRLTGSVEALKDALGVVQTVVVLGGASDIGVAIASRLAGPRQATVVLAGRHEDRLAAAAERIRGAGAGRVEILDFDATDTSSHERFVACLAATVGDIDVVIVAFGLLGDQRVDEKGGTGAVTLATTNYVGAVSVCLPLARLLQSQGHGTLVILSSVAGGRVRRANFIYGSSKAGLDGFAQGLGDALAGSGVSVVIVRPGFVHTRMTQGMKPPPFACTPEAVARATADALATGKEVVYVPARLQPVLGIVRLLPRRVFRLVERWQS